MSKLFITLLFSAFAITTYAADTDKQTDGAELGTNETPQARDQAQDQAQAQAKNKHPTSSDRQTKKHHSKKRTGAHPQNSSQQNNGSSENNPLQPTEAEPAPGAAH